MTTDGSDEPWLIVFDCDGTIVDSQHVIAEAMAHAFVAEGLTPPSLEAVRAIIGLSLFEAVARLFGETNGTKSNGGETGRRRRTVQLGAADEDEARIHRLVARYKRAFTELRQRPGHREPLFDGARQTIERLAGLETVLLGIATGKSHVGVTRLLTREALAHCFHTIQTADTSPSKPHPDMIERAMAETGVARDRTVMVGDTTFDMEMARAAGVHAIGVGWGYHAPAALKASGARWIAPDFAALERVLLRHASD